MARIKQIFALVAVLFTISITACRSSKIVAETTETTDTTIIERTVTEHSVPVLSPRDTTFIELPIVMVKNGFKAEKKGSKNAKATIQVKDDTLHFDCECDSQQIIGKYLSENKTITNKTNTVTIRYVPVKYVPKGVKVLAWIGGVALLISIGWFLKKIL